MRAIESPRHGVDREQLVELALASLEMELRVCLDLLLLSSVPVLTNAARGDKAPLEWGNENVAHSFRIITFADLWSFAGMPQIGHKFATLVPSKARK